jgi:hypothetical protein
VLKVKYTGLRFHAKAAEEAHTVGGETQSTVSVSVTDCGIPFAVAVTGMV